MLAGAQHGPGAALMPKRSLFCRPGKKLLVQHLYVTLEPCCHHGKTPPCTDAIIAAGIKRVIVSVIDPNPLVAGKGIEVLRKSGIQVDVGLLSRESVLVNEDFFWSITQKKAFITLKLALTLDGRIADVSGNSKWITGEQSRKIVHELRRKHAAVAVGRSTLEADDPMLNVRHRKGFSPARIIFSSNKNIPPESYFFRNAHEAKSIVVMGGGSSKDIQVNSGIEFWQTGENDPRSSLNVFLEMAFQQNLTSILVEGGQKLASQFLEFGLVNRIYLFYGNKLFGNGKDGISFTGGLPVNGCISLKDAQFKSVGADFLVSGIPVFSGSSVSNRSRFKSVPMARHCCS